MTSEGDDEVNESLVGSSPAPDPTKLTSEILATMRSAGYPKPEGVSWSDWMGPKKLNHRHELIAMYAAAGVPSGEIARQLEFTGSRMSLILNTTRMKAAIARIRDKTYGRTVEARFKSMTPKAIAVLDRILDNPNEKSTTLIKASEQVLNRSLGKPKETIEIKNDSVRAIFDFLDGKRSTQNHLAFSPNPTQPDTRTIDIPVEDIAESINPSAQASIDEWVNNNVPDDVHIGKGES